MGQFLEAERKRQSQFKQTSSYYSVQARQDGFFRGKFRPFCLPVEQASENLQAGIRDHAITCFANHAIQWHQGVGRFPSNHLCDSQVCAVNFLAPFAFRPEAVVELLKPVFPKVTAARPIEATGEYVAFEWIGSENYLKEKVGLSGKRTRGANCTSADAAVLLEEEGGVRHVVLIEWKYTESYSPAPLATSARGTDRTAIYQHLYAADSFVVRKDRLPSFESLFYEPFYQFFRQQSLAHKMEDARELGAERVSLLHIAPTHNHDFQKVTSPLLRSSGETATSVWRSLLAQPDRFISVSTESLFRPNLAEKFPELQPWWDYVSQRYSWLTEPVSG